MTAPETPDGWVPRSVYVAPPFRIRDLFPMAFTRLGDPEKPEKPRRPEFLGDLLVRPLPDEPETPPNAHPGWQRNAVAFTVSGALMADYLPRKAGPETREEWEAREAEKAQERAERAEAWATYDNAMRTIPALIASGATSVHRALAEVWNLHRPIGDSHPTCQGCDPGSYAEDAPEWPCSTVAKVAEVLCVPLPAHYALARRHQEDA